MTGERYFPLTREVPEVTPPEACRHEWGDPFRERYHLGAQETSCALCGAKAMMWPPLLRDWADARAAEGDDKWRAIGDRAALYGRCR